MSRLYIKMTKHASTSFFLQFLYCFTALHSFSLKNCTIEDSETVEVLCQDYGLKEIPHDIPQNSEMLDVSFNNISKIKATDLRNLSKVLSLLLNNNQLYHIDDTAFADLKSLTILRLSFNKLTNLTNHIFVGLDKLVSLYLQHNHISLISPRAFQPLVSLHRVNLDWNHIDTRSIAVLFQSPTVEVISLKINQIKSFDSDDLSFNTTNVKTLNLDSNPLEKFSLKQDVFPHLHSISLFRSTTVIKWEILDKKFLRSLTEITLGGRFLSFDTYKVILHSTSTLQTLHLTAVNPKMINSTVEVACTSPSLRTLELSSNLLHTIDDNLLRPCSQLTGLVLTLNDLTKMSDQSLKSLTQLTFLYLNENYLTKVPVTIRGLSALESLDLSVNLISELDCLDFINLTKLTTLELRGNRIARLQECHFQKLHNLKSLYMSENPILSLENAFRVNMSKLDTLDLSGNAGHLPIKYREFMNLSSLRYLNLRSKTYYLSNKGAFERLNHLKTLAFSINWYAKDLFQGLTHLENLELHLSFMWDLKDSKNYTDEPPFSGLPNLKDLSLKVNDPFNVNLTPELLSGLVSLQSFSADHFFKTSVHPDTFKYTPHLQKLKIINSLLSTLPRELFEPIPQLQHLDLSNNTFQSLDFLVNLKAIRWLRATRNQLSIMNETMIQTLTALRFLDLTNNSLTCECSNAGFQQWALTNNQTQVINGHQYKCAFPVSQQESMFLDFDTHYCWKDYGFICFISSFYLLLFTIFVAFVYNFLRWQLAYTYYLFLAYLYDAISRKKGTDHLYDAFISYNVHDEDWVYSEMLPALEGQQGWRLCLHHRDFEPGKPIVENITDAIYSSRKTICVISQHYLQSEWCSREIQIASVRLFDEQKDVLVLVFLEDIPTWQMSPYYRIRKLVKKHTYLSWPQAAQHKGVFWQKLNQALKTGNANNDKRHLIIEPEDA